MKRNVRHAWDAALEIIATLRAGGHVALLAGGCVRDRLLGLAPKDFDVATDAPPPRVKELFPKARKVGAKFGVMLVRKYGHHIEVATFRTDSAYTDGRHPDQIEFGSEIDDALRRDFTINGLFLDPIADRVIDHVGGQTDLRAGILRTIGEPELRFAEDHLRMLRAVRFAARLGFRIEAATMAAIQRFAPQLRLISAERIWQELEAILTGPERTTGWSLLLETGLRDHLCEGWPAGEAEDELTRRRLAALPARLLEPALPLAACLEENDPKAVAGICRSLRLSNQLLNAVVWLVQSLPRARAETSVDLADLKQLMVRPWWPLLLELLRASLIAGASDLAPYERVRHRARAVSADHVAPPPLVTGDDLRGMGLEPSARLGRILEQLYRDQLNEVLTTRDEALDSARRMIASTVGEG